MLNRCLRHAERKAAVDRRAHRNFIEESTIDANNRNGAEVAAAMNGLPQDMRPIRTHERGNFDAIDDGVEARTGAGLCSYRINTSIRTPTVCHLEDTVVDIVFAKIEGFRTGFTR